MRLYIFFIQFLGYLWHLVLYVILIPFILVHLGQGLDYFVMTTLLDWDYGYWIGLVPVIVVNLLTLVFLSSGVLIIIEAAITLYRDARAFPFTTVQHEAMTPSELTTGGWYARTRHPMVLGYLLVLVGLGIYFGSPTLILWWVPLLGGLMVEYALIMEESQMYRWFGDEYVKYQKQTPVLFPKLFSKPKK